MCSERESEPIAFHFLPEGYNVFVLKYSVRPHTFPTQILEVAALLELLYKNSDEWHINTEKIIIIGFSAGAHLAASYSTLYDSAHVRSVFENSKPVAAQILGYPVITAEPEFSHKGSFINLSGKDSLTDEEIALFSCEKNVKSTTPPAFIWHTAEDRSVPMENSLMYAAALHKENVPVEMHIYPFGNHGLSTADDQTSRDPSQEFLPHVTEWLTALKKWLKYMNLK